MSRGPGRVQRQLAEILTKYEKPIFTTKRLCRLVFRTDRVEKKHRVSVIRALKQMSRQGTLNVWRALGDGRYRDDVWFNDDLTPKRNKPIPKTAPARDKRPRSLAVPKT